MARSDLSSPLIESGILIKPDFVPVKALNQLTLLAAAAAASAAAADAVGEAQAPALRAESTLNAC